MAQFDQFAVASRQSLDGAHRSLAGRVCVVGDGSTTVGSGIVHELLKDGATVIVPLKSQELIDKVVEENEGPKASNLFPVLVDVRDEEACAQFVEDVVQKHGAIDHGISVFGTTWSGGLLTNQDLPEFERVMKASFYSHFVFSKHILPAIKNTYSASMLFISNGAGKRVISPETSLYTVAASAVYGIILAAQSQYAEYSFRITEIRNYALFKRHTDIGSHNFQDWFGQKAYSNWKIGKMVVEALQSSKRKERIIVSPDRLDGEALTV